MSDPIVINQRLVDAVIHDNPRDLERVLEDDGHVWLGSTECSHNHDVGTNPILLAAFYGSVDCLQVFRRWWPDVATWQLGRWNLLMWGIQGQHEEVVEWALRHGCDVLDEEAPSPEGTRLRRTALTLATQMGDPQWLATVLHLALHTQPAQTWRERPSKVDPWNRLIQREFHHNGVSALGAALYEWADHSGRLMTEGLAPATDSIDFEGCIALLASLGFLPDTHTTLGAKLTCSMANDNAAHPAYLDAYRRSTELAVALGSGRVKTAHVASPFSTSFSDVRRQMETENRPAVFTWPTLDSLRAAVSIPMDPYALAGARLDVNWYDFLHHAGVPEGPDADNAWALSALATLRQWVDGHTEVALSAFDDLERTLRDSWSNVPTLRALNPWHGEEMQFLQTFRDVTRMPRHASPDSAPSTMDLDQLKAYWSERLSLLDSTMAKEHRREPIARTRL